MMRILTSLANPQTRNTPAGYAYTLEPHICRYDFNSTEKALFIWPFQLISYASIIMIVVGLGVWLYGGEQTICQALALIQLFFAPFYFPGVIMYRKYFKKEQSVTLDIDTKDGFIQYQHLGRRENILFHPQQIERLEMHASMMLPYRLDYLSIHLKGGKKVHISGLIAEPEEIIRHIRRPFMVKKHLFNPFPSK